MDIIQDDVDVIDEFLRVTKERVQDKSQPTDGVPARNVIVVDDNMVNATRAKSVREPADPDWTPHEGHCARIQLAPQGPQRAGTNEYELPHRL